MENASPVSIEQVLDMLTEHTGEVRWKEGGANEPDTVVLESTAIFQLMRKDGRTEFKSTDTVLFQQELNVTSETRAILLEGLPESQQKETLDKYRAQIVEDGIGAIRIAIGKYLLGGERIQKDNLFWDVCGLMLDEVVPVKQVRPVQEEVKKNGTGLVANLPEVR